MSKTPACLKSQSVLLAGVGNIGSFLAPLIARSGIARLTLLDRDVVEQKNLLAQDYAPEDVGRPKAEGQAERLKARFPDLEISHWVGDLEDLPLGIANCDLILGALDSRRARQVLISEIAWPLGVPVIDGGVGDGIGRVQVFCPGPESACLECTWGQADYRLLAAEYPCQPGASAANVPPTGAPAYLGSFTASLAAAEAVRLLSAPESRESYEIVFDLNALQMRKFGLRRSSRCRHDHAVVSEKLPVPASVTFTGVNSLIEANFGSRQVSVECRRGLGAGSMAGARYLDRDSLRARGETSLKEFGFVPGDHLRVRGEGRQVFLEVTAEG